ncbi:hypothetical protein E4U54_002281, partial [Claviceps lovelessii]
DIYALMFNMKLYEIAYRKLKSNPGNMTPGIDEVTLDGISKEVFHEIIKAMKDESINDERFIRLIWKTLKAGYVEFNRTKLSIIGTPQGSIISPLLSNIYLNELDKFVNELKIKFDKGVRAKVSPEYKHLDYLRQKALKNMNNLEALKLLKDMQKIKARIPNDQDFRRLYYVRYADD